MFDFTPRCGGGGAPAAVLAKGTGGVSLPVAGATRQWVRHRFSPWTWLFGGIVNGGAPKWMFYKGKYPIDGNLQFGSILHFLDRLHFVLHPLVRTDPYDSPYHRGARWIRT